MTTTLQAPDTKARRKLLFFVTEDYYFISHRLPLAVAAQAAGFDVSVVTRVRDGEDAIRDAGLRIIPFENVRSGLNAFSELATLVRLIRVYRRERPDVVHHVAMKPMLYGSTAARFAGRPHIINAVAGMGWLFTSGAGRARWLKRLVRSALGRALRGGVVLVQNPDDARLIAEFGVPERQIHLIAGSGVDLERFHPNAPSGEVPMVLLPARLLWDKGVADFVAAARRLRAKGIRARFVLAGEPDPLNPASIPVDQLTRWVREGAVEYLGWVADMPSLLASCQIVCLPSSREGLPKSLIEAAAAGKAIVTTDVPGCREMVRDGENGLLVPPGNPEALADALERLILNVDLCLNMGQRSRARAEREFGLHSVIQQTLALYEDVQA